MATSKLFLGSTLFLISLVLFSVNVYAQGNRGETATAQQSSAVSSPQAEIEPGKTGENLKWFFTVLVYPALVVAVFLLLLGSVIYVTGHGSGFGFVRRATGALLPFLLLTFMLLVTEKGDDPVKEFFLNRSALTYILIGVVVGAALVECGKRLMQTDDDRAGSIYNLFLSSMVVFLLYSFMKGFLDNLIYFLFSMIMAGGIDIVFGRPFKPKQSPRKTNVTSHPVSKAADQREKGSQSKAPLNEEPILASDPQPKETKPTAKDYASKEWDVMRLHKKPEK